MKTLLRGLAVATVVAVLLVVGVVGGAVWWFRHAAFEDRALPVRETTVVIPRGAPFAEVAAQLQREHVVASAAVLRLLARWRHDDARARAGEFRFAAHETPSEVLERLITGGSQVAVWVTVPEGYTSDQIARDLAAHDIGPAQRFAEYFHRSTIEVDGARTRSLEGFLFPSTYLVPTNASPATVATIMVEQFRKELPPDAEARARALDLTVPQVVTVASLVEREAKANDERALMAGVYYNRLRRGMPLQVDATIEYIFPTHKTDLTQADMRIDSPYNTYEHAGLPPTPIANPGEPSLEAAFHPQRSDYLYYVYRGDGHHAFSRTLAEHNANIERYLH